MDYTPSLYVAAFVLALLLAMLRDEFWIRSHARQK
jgi:hypothetical protein